MLNYETNYLHWLYLYESLHGDRMSVSSTIEGISTTDAKCALVFSCFEHMQWQLIRLSFVLSSSYSVRYSVNNTREKPCHKRDIAKWWDAGRLGHGYAGNPLACAGDGKSQLFFDRRPLSFAMLDCAAIHRCKLWSEMRQCNKQRAIGNVRCYCALRAVGISNNYAFWNDQNWLLFKDSCTVAM